MSNLRRTGRTTKILNNDIEEFFTTGSVLVIDHIWDSKEDMLSEQRNSHIRNLFINRLYTEHRFNVKDFTVEFDNISTGYLFTLIKNNNGA